MRSRGRIARRAVGLSLAVLVAGSAMIGCSDQSVEIDADPSEGQPLPEDQPTCSHLRSLVLLAQTVPSAVSIPCVASLPPGWRFGERAFNSGLGMISLDSDIAGMRAAQILLSPSCDTSGASPSPPGPGEAGRKYVRVLETDPQRGIRADTYFVFEGGCVTHRFVFAPGTPGATALDLAEGFGFVERADVAAYVEQVSGGERLCGAGVDCGVD